MRRFAAFILMLTLLIALAIPASAASSVRNIKGHYTVSQNGDCSVSLQMNFRLDGVLAELVFPLPENARNITLNGASVRATTKDGKKLVDLSKICTVPGNYNLAISYTVKDLVYLETEDDDGKKLPKNKQVLMLEVPMLSGFAYPVETMEFTITLPSEVTTKPSFFSGYYRYLISSSLDFTISGNQITGSLTDDLKDRETLYLELPAAELFPQIAARYSGLGTEDIVMIVLAVVALIYWLVTLRAGFTRRVDSAAPPAGLTAGQLGTVLIGQGTDLTMMVLDWAQLGYILIQLDDNGRVLLHKRMEMGNERSGFENRVYRSLFGRRRMIDGTGYHYAQLCRKVAASKADVHNLFLRSSGNPNIFRAITVLAGVFGGASLGLALAGGALLAVLVAVFFAILGGIASWSIQQWVRGLQLRGRDYLLLSLLCAAVWVLLGVLAGDLIISACTVAFQFLAGFAAAYGGRRTETGHQLRGQVLGLRRYLRTVTPAQLQHICRTDPDYFFYLAPCAIALGVGNTFAKGFGHVRLSGCPYLTTGMDGHLTATEWSHIMNRAVTALDERQKRLPLERLFGK